MKLDNGSTYHERIVNGNLNSTRHKEIVIKAYAKNAEHVIAHIPDLADLAKFVAEKVQRSPDFYTRMCTLVNREEDVESAALKFASIVFSQAIETINGQSGYVDESVVSGWMDKSKGKIENRAIVVLAHITGIVLGDAFDAHPDTLKYFREGYHPKLQVMATWLCGIYNDDHEQIQKGARDFARKLGI